MVHFVDELDLKGRINPVTGKEYSPNSTIIMLEENDTPDMICGKGENGIYTVRMATGNRNWEMTVGDFIDYARKEDLEALVCIPGDRLSQVRNVYKGHHYNDRKLRTYEPHYLVHSTTYESGKRILSDGYLKSWNRLRQEGQMIKEVPIGRSLGDSDYFSDYIMFSQGAVSSEIVVMSKQAGEIIMDVNCKYKTGIRFYLNAEAIAEDGILLRDGIHIKVKDELPLEKYLLWWADWERAGLSEPVSTPLEFTERSNAMFQEREANFFYQ